MTATPILDKFCATFDVERTPTGRLTTNGAERLVMVMTQRMARLADELERRERIIAAQAVQIAKLRGMGAEFN